MMRTRESIMQTLDERKYERAMREMGDICQTHRDYMWDVLYQTP